MTYREIIYMIMDELKIMSDDSSFTQDHIRFLCDKYRVFLLKKQYLTNLKSGFIPESNYQEICLDLIEVPAICGEPCEGGTYLRSKDKIPVIIPIGSPRVYPTDYYQGEITYVSRDRMRYSGYNRWFRNIIYCSLAPDNYLYFKSGNPQFLYLENVRFSAIFEDAGTAFGLSCDSSETCDIMDSVFPMESSLVPTLIELIVAEIKKALYAPEDAENNAMDDLANLVAYLRRNAKSDLQKQIEA